MKPPGGDGGGEASPSMPGNPPIPASHTQHSNTKRSNINNRQRNDGATSRQLAEYYTAFAPQSFDRFFTVTSTGNRNLSEIDTVLANEELERTLGGPPREIRELRSGGLAVEIRSVEQSRAILNLKSLAGCEVDVTSNDRMNQCKGSIYYRNGPRYTEEQICNALNKSGETRVAEVYRMKKRVDGVLVDMPVYLITFQSTQLPSHVSIGWTRCSTRQYIPRPRRCFNCQRFGHGAKTCRTSQKVCVQCSVRSSEEETHPNPCTSPAKCSNCDEAHAASSTACSEYRAEQEVLNLQAHERLSYLAAKRRVAAVYATLPPARSVGRATASDKPQTIPSSYASAAGSSSCSTSLDKNIPPVTKKVSPSTMQVSPVTKPASPVIDIFSPVIRTGKSDGTFRNMTFGELSSRSTADAAPRTADSKKRNLSDPSTPRAKHSNGSNREPILPSASHEMDTQDGDVPVTEKRNSPSKGTRGKNGKNKKK